MDALPGAGAVDWSRVVVEQLVVLSSASVASIRRAASEAALCVAVRAAAAAQRATDALQRILRQLSAEEKLHSQGLSQASQSQSSQQKKKPVRSAKYLAIAKQKDQVAQVIFFILDLMTFKFIIPMVNSNSRWMH